MKELGAAALQEYERLCTRYPRREATLLPCLRIVEREFGCIDENGMELAARLVGVSPAKVWGVVTFYTHYRRSTDGKYVLQVCSTLPCALGGSERLFDHLSKRLGLRNGETTSDDLFTLKKVECLANCDRAPCLQVNENYHDAVSTEEADRLIDELRGSRDEYTGQSYRLPKHRYEPWLLKSVEEAGSETIEHYLKREGYTAAPKALKMKPDELINLVKTSGLRGRGGAGFPTGMKWGFTDKKSGKPRYLVCNADESEPGTFKDKMLIERDPHRIIEGCIIAAWAIESHVCYIYIRGEFGLGARILQKAVEEAHAKRFLGKNIFRSGWDFDITIHRGAGAYICGEETGLLTSLEGDRGYPKIKPPFPAVEGLFRCPTIVNNVETLACVPLIVNEGAESFRKVGTEKSPGRKIFCVCGQVERPGLYEVPLGIPLRELIELAGGVHGGRKLKAVVPGGMSAAVLTPNEIDVAMDFDSLLAAKTMLGSGGVYVLDDTVCMVDALWNTLRFFHHESCGQCTPCREGTGWLEKMLMRMERGQGRMEDLAMIDEIASDMCGRTICVLADAAAMPTRSILAKFRGEFEEHIKQKRCPFKAEAKPLKPPRFVIQGSGFPVAVEAEH